MYNSVLKRIEDFLNLYYQQGFVLVKLIIYLHMYMHKLCLYIYIIFSNSMP